MLSDLVQKETRLTTLTKCNEFFFFPLLDQSEPTLNPNHSCHKAYKMAFTQERTHIYGILSQKTSSRFDIIYT
jgi:hypothetical protein